MRKSLLIHFLTGVGFILLFGGTLPMLAESDYGPESDALHSTVHHRRYPGGADEEDLQVQSELLVPELKINPKVVQGQVLKIKIESGADEESQEE